MSWNLFLDDERWPADSDENEYVICRSLEHVVLALTRYGLLTYATFDHDLGEDQPTGMDVVKYLVDMDMKYDNVFANDFTWYTHSQNPVGRENIDLYLKGYFKHKHEPQPLYKYSSYRASRS